MTLAPEDVVERDRKGALNRKGGPTNSMFLEVWKLSPFLPYAKVLPAYSGRLLPDRLRKDILPHRGRRSMIFGAALPLHARLG